MRLHAGLPLFMWANVVDTTMYLINWGNTSYLYGGILEELWKSKKVKYSFFKVFGSEGFVYIDKDNRKKLYAKYQKCYFFGYVVDGLGYRLWDNNNGKIIRSRDVIFNEKFL